MHPTQLSLPGETPKASPNSLCSGSPPKHPPLLQSGSLRNKESSGFPGPRAHYDPPQFRAGVRAQAGPRRAFQGPKHARGYRGDFRAPITRVKANKTLQRPLCGTPPNAAPRSSRFRVVLENPPFPVPEPHLRGSAFNSVKIEPGIKSLPHPGALTSLPLSLKGASFVL